MRTPHSRQRGRRRYRAILSASAYTEVVIEAASEKEARARADSLKYEMVYELFDHEVEQVFKEDAEEAVIRLGEGGEGPLHILHPDVGVDPGRIEGRVAEELCHDGDVVV